ncbi:MAG: aldolase/citrate lyase family protein [Gammaproteobacteria bacterium]
MKPLHPDEILYGGEKGVPTLPVCEHIAGNERLIRKAFALQAERGPVFDITCDCEDGAPAGGEIAHAEMVAQLIRSGENRYGMAGARIHGFDHPHWRQEVDILIQGAGERLAYLTLPKPTSVDQVVAMTAYIRECAAQRGIERTLPIHVLIETHGALRDVWKIAELPEVEVIDFGLMDFVSAHLGAIPDDCMRSPGQFEHQLLRRAKAEIVAAALANGCVPAHNVTLDLKNAAQTRSDALRAHREFGFLRMWSIYPTQIDAIIEAMRPPLGDVERAAHILLAAQDKKWAPIQYRGELQDRASYRYYWQLLKKAHLTGAAIPEPARERFFSPPANQ